MVSSFRLITDCAVAPPHLFALSLDIGAHVDSMAASRERVVGGVAAGRIGLGQSVTWRAWHLGLPWTMTSTITALEEGRRFVDEQTRGPFRRFRHVHEFTPTATGTRMVDEIELASPLFGIAAERLVLVPYLRRLILQRNAHLVARAASGAEPS